MKTINYIKQLFFIALVCGITSSCSKEFLEKTPATTLTPQQAFNDPSLLDAAVQGMYDRLQSVGYYGRDFVVLPELASDNAQLRSDNSGRFINTYGFSLTPSNDDVAGPLDAAYEAIHGANLIIENAQNCEDCEQEDLDNALGNAYAIRALAHFDLTRLFSFPYNVTDGSVAPGANGQGGNLGVPLVLTSIPEDFTRNTLDEVYNQVILDLQQAENLLPNTSQNDVYMSSYGASALLARLYLYKGDYPKAIAKANEVIAGPYSLTSNADYVDSWSTAGSSETIFEISFSNTDYPGTNALGYIYIVEGYGDFFLTNELYSLYNPNDVRLGLYQENDGEFYNYKFPSRDGIAGLANTPVLRLSEIILIKAEALAKSGNDAGARTALDMIRFRANPNAAPTTSSGNQLISAILQERRKELAFEGHRLYDIVRNKRDMTREEGDVTGSATQTLNYPSPKMIFPISKDETDVNPEFQQNVGY